MFLEILQNSQENTCASLFLIKLQTSARNLIKKETLVQVFSYEFFLIIPFFIEHLRATASEMTIKHQNRTTTVTTHKFNRNVVTMVYAKHILTKFYSENFFPIFNAQTVISIFSSF